MTTIERPLVRGRCPGALEPMLSGDGLIVRVRPQAARLSLSDFAALGLIAGEHGNGQIDLTRKANLQLRGISEASLSVVQARLHDLGLLDASAVAERVRNILMGPLSGRDPSEYLDMTPLAHDLAGQLARAQAAEALPAKFSFVLDGGGAFGVQHEGADIRLFARSAHAVEVRINDALGEAWAAQFLPAEAVRVAVQLAEGFAVLAQAGSRSLTPDRAAQLAAECRLRKTALDVLRDQAFALPSRLGVLPLSEECFVVGVGVPFGRLTGEMVDTLVTLASAECLPEVRLSPWRTLYLLANSRVAASRVVAQLSRFGFVVDGSDPILSVDACPGAPACLQAHGDTRSAAITASQLAGELGARSIHVSGCPKGCARSAVADVVLVANASGFAFGLGQRADGVMCGEVPAGLEGLVVRVKEVGYGRA